MSAPLTLENCLILACARTEPDVERIQELVERGPDWLEIVRKAERWRLVPSIYTHLKQVARSGQVPGWVTERLRHLYHRDMIHGAAMRELLRAALLRFAEVNVPVIVLEDAALATVVYPSPSLRPIGRLDLLVHRDDRARADAVLRSLSDALGRPSGAMPDGHPRIPHIARESLSLLDVRHDLFRPSRARQVSAFVSIPPSHLWERARPVQIASVATLVLGHEDMLLHLAVHLTTVAGFRGEVRTLRDIGEICRRYGGAIDWRELRGRARAYDTGKRLYHALRLARELVGATTPCRSLTELRRSFGQLPLEDRFIAARARRALLFDDQREARLATVGGLGVRLMTTSRARDGITIACRHLARACQDRVRRLATRPDQGTPHRADAGHSRSSSPTRQTPARSTYPGDRSIDVHWEVAVTYDQNASDGLGAQLQRIYGLYALSRALDIKYVHTPVGQVDYQGLIPLLAGRTDPDFATRCNAFFTLPSDDFDLDACERLRVPYPNDKRIEQYREYAAQIGRPVLLQAHEPYGYTDLHPEAYLALRTVSPYREFRPEGPIRICIHVRRGDAALARDPRLLSNAYYLRACGAVVHALRHQRASFVVRLHTELPPRPYTLHPGSPGMFVRVNQPTTLDPAAHSLEDFERLPNLTMVLNVAPREALDDFATADVLILSRSCFGYVGGLLNPHGLVIAPPHLPPPRNFHAALPDWLVADEHGNVDATELAASLAARLRRRGQVPDVAEPKVIW